MQKNKLKTIRITIIILIILLIILGVIIIYFLPESSQKRYGYEIMGVYKGENSEEIEENTLGFKNVELLNSFKGEMPVSTGVSKLKNIFTVQIPNIMEQVKDLSEEQLNEYYENNISIISDNLKVKDKTSFINMINKYKEIDCDLKTDAKECELSENMNVHIKLTYSNNQIIECDMLGIGISNFELKF